MALEIGRILINEPAGTGNVAYTGMGFQPKALLFFSSGSASTGAGFDNQFSTGFCNSASSRAYVSSVSANGSVLSEAYVRHSAAGVLARVTPTGGGNAAEADIVSFDADGMTLSWGTVGAAGPRTHVIGFGGSDLTNAGIKEFTTPGITGSVSYTGVGFKPDSIILISANNTVAPPNTKGSAHHLFSVADATNESCTSGASLTGHGVDNSSRSYASTGFINQVHWGEVTKYVASLTTMDADGFTLDWTTTAGAGAYMYALCLKGVTTSMGTTTQRTSVGTTVVSGLGLLPRGILCHSGWANASGTNRTQAVTLGAAAAVANQGNSSVRTTDNVTPTKTNRAESDVAIVSFYTATNVIVGEAGISAIADGTFTVNWTTADASARLTSYIAFGDGPATGSGAGSLLLRGVGA